MILFSFFKVYRLEHLHVHVYSKNTHEGTHMLASVNEERGREAKDEAKNM